MANEAQEVEARAEVRGIVLNCSLSGPSAMSLTTNAAEHGHTHTGESKRYFPFFGKQKRVETEKAAFAETDRGANIIAAIFHHL